MEIPDYETILFYNYFKRPNSFKVNIELAIKKLKKEYEITNEIFYQESLKEIKSKFEQIEVLREKFKEDATKAIECWKKETENLKSAQESIEFWNREIGIKVKDGHAFGFSIYSEDGFSIVKSYSLSKVDLNKILLEINQISNKLEFQQDEINKNEVELHSNIFLKDYFLLFDILFNKFEINDKSRADIKYVYDKMKFENFIHSNIKYSDFLKFISEKYNTEIGRISDYSETSQRKSIFNSSLELFKINRKKLS